MARDPLAVLLTVRQRAVDQSRQGLAACLKAETEAIEAIRAIDDAVPRERALADRYPEQPHGMQVHAAWLQRLRAARLRAVAAFTAAEGQTAATRAVLAAARAAARAVERTIEARAAVARAEAEKSEQHAMDDVARGQWLARGGTEPDPHVEC